MKKIQSFVREHQLWRNALWLLLFVPLFFLSQLPLISMLFSIRNGLDAWIVTLLTLVATVVVLFVFYVVMKKSPLENIDIRVITWPALGRNFLFFLLLIANNMLAYPLLQQEGSDTTKNQMVLMELQAHAPFFCHGDGRRLCCSDSRGVALSSHHTPFDFSRGRTDWLLGWSTLFHLLAWTEHFRRMGSLWRNVLDHNLGGLSLQADRV